MKLKQGSVRRACALFATFCAAVAMTGLIIWGLDLLVVKAVEIAPTFIPVELYPPHHACVDIIPLCP
ncbi:MAG: hypothetical protein A2845_01460 [Candidatus Lloydbacteria bacterium RIFCSPHIGHO2_01_FULL_49_22]|uniref:Uncharacterized protein n=1 Tax=Candidatus Lloydbacteria bacterium RIFCSPHIGHO2_01_FULL_49_22 TaxID=1798658 RepID=A0A1G2CXJ3_9BACT|nr:MAG: hypothetical protein A2845_01460 [Candidatus Lloydbacteria bacterium RIFCSPHIGHO2_01_FULL_49_22]OGZ09965.1 MAG: hypothetical protein A3C14_04625 [Candidatus Lloydbacteria bacterium RIFCSPHIGHO2_02_FULL_50_18]